MLSFKVDEQLFKSVKDDQLKNFTNTLQDEPYRRLDLLLVGALTGENTEMQSLIKILDTFNYEKFEDLRKQWLKNAAFQWLIQGHLAPEKAIAIQNKATQIFAQNQMKVADQVSSPMAKLPQKTVLNYMAMNQNQEDSTNPNSAIQSYFQLGEMTYENYAIMQCLMGLIKEPMFNQLRNKEQLGYIV